MLSCRITELRRRREDEKRSLQAFCLSWAFIGSIWDDLGHTRADGDRFLMGRQDGYLYGKPANRVYWMRRGFEAESPAACNTFTAPASKVA